MNLNKIGAHILKPISAAIQGSKQLLGEAERLTDQLLQKYGSEVSISFPGTIYYLPIAYGLTGRKVDTLKEIRNEIIIAKSLLSKKGFNQEKASELGQIALICSEILEALLHLKKKVPYEKPCLGFISDVIFRELSLGLAEGTIPGIVVILGKSPDNKELKKILLNIKEKNLICLITGQVIQQTQELDIELGLNGKIVPIGYGPTTIVHAANLIIRAPLMFGNLKPGSKDAILDYIKNRVPVFMISLGKTDEKIVALVNGLSTINIPVLTDQKQLSSLKNVYQVKPDLMIEKGCELKGIKITREIKPKIPVEYGSLYEGEKIRREHMYAEFGGRSNTSFEITKIFKPSKIKDGAIHVKGPEINEFKEGSSAPIGIVVKIAGSKLERELEPVLERRIHQFLNKCEGVMHLGQRSEVWLRISKEAVKKGLKIKHIGGTLTTMFHSTFPQLVEKVEVDVITDHDLVESELQEVESTYAERDEKLKLLKEEEVDAFYGCILCQSFAPNHVCVITPERISLCGSTSWLDARISYKLDPSGPNFIVPKGECLDPVAGEWRGVNDTVKEKSHDTVKRIFLHSIFGHTHTSCGCFEAIAFYIPEVNGIGIVHRGFKDPTINGMPFSTMAGFCGGGRQVEGFQGIGIKYIKSDKFLRADGGIGRIVWMPMELKLTFKGDIPKDLFEKIATEHDAKNLKELKSFLKSVDHPVTKRW